MRSVATLYRDMSIFCIHLMMSSMLWSRHMENIQMLYTIHCPFFSICTKFLQHLHVWALV